MWVKVLEQRSGGDGIIANVAVTLRSVSDPAGAVRAVQTHDYVHEVYDRSAFTARRDLSTAKYDDGGTLAGDQGMHLTFKATKAATSRCDGHIRTRVGRLEGTLKLRTGPGHIGLVTELPRTAVLLHHDGDCPRPPVHQCPGTNRGIRARMSTRRAEITKEVDAHVEEGASTASIRLYQSRYRGSATGATRVTREIRATVPAGAVTISDSFAKIRPPEGSFFTGRMNASFAQPETPHTQNPFTCGSRRTYIYSLRDATVTGNLRGNWWIGEDFRLDPDRVETATGYRNVMVE
jgi:hypothetical protein